jgi:DNA-binding CsgD family transcriptional regulator
MTGSLIGRDAELELLDRLLGEAGTSSMLVRGAPGVGKTALIDAARQTARHRGLLVLACAGVSSEARLTYAGLHQLMGPMLRQPDELPAAGQAALQAALGVTTGPVPEMALVGMAVLDLIGQAAQRRAVLLIADDIHWLDARTCDVLAFVSRRLDADDAALLATGRDGELTGNPLASAGLQELELGPLEADAAATLLSRHGADLDPATRARILAEAAGNPLALVELPVAARDPDLAAAAPPGSMPLTSRLERAFAARLPQLPPQARTILLVAALAGEQGAAKILAAASLAAGSERSQSDLAPAVAAGLVRLNGDDLVFRHPLTRSAVQQAATVAERAAAHAALAASPHSEPDARIWHRAAATTGPDEELARDLEEVAGRAESAGAFAVATSAQRRAAEVGTDPALQAERWLRAAEFAGHAGQEKTQLLRAAESVGLDAGQRARADFLRETAGSARRSGTNPIAAFVAAADDMRRSGDHDRACEALLMIAMRCYFSNPDARLRDLMIRAVDALDVAPDDPAVLNILALALPLERGAVVIKRISALRPGQRAPEGDHLLGTAATAVGAYDLCGGFLASAIEGLRAQGHIHSLAQALHTWAWAGVNFGDPAIALPAAEEARQLFAEAGETLWAACAPLVTATMAGRRGDADQSEALIAESERILLFAGLGPLLAMVCLARGIAALGADRNAVAYEHLARIFDPHDHAHHPHLQAWAVADLVDAALHSGRRDDARELCTGLAAMAAQTRSPLLEVGLLVAAPQLADDDHAGQLFERALRRDLAGWPLHRARLLLAYGAWLRRQQRAAQAREPLRAARDAFDALAALPWAQRARQELAAAGERSLPREPGPLDVLSPQELLIAQLAGNGLTNRQIGQQLYLSHRTVGSHLYRIFPKLGIATRAELAAAMATARGMTD